MLLKFDSNTIRYLIRIFDILCRSQHWLEGGRPSIMPAKRRRTFARELLNGFTRLDNPTTNEWREFIILAPKIFNKVFEDLRRLFFLLLRE